MNLSEIVSITNLPGLWSIVKKRADGMIVKSLVDDKSTFVSQRQNMFTPLENITMYTTEDTLELSVILREMKKQEGSNAAPDVKADGATLRTYFSKIVPNYDQERVYTSDIVKLIKWFNILNNRNIITLEEPAKAETAAAEVVAEEKPKAKKTKKADAEPKEEASEEPKPKAKKTKKAE